VLIDENPRDEITDGLWLRQPTNLILMADHYRVSDFVSSVASHVHEFHKQISDKIALNNANNVLRADVRNILETFNVGEVVKKLHSRSAEPFQILNKLNDNVYVIDFGISSTLNVKNLVDYPII